MTHNLNGKDFNILYKVNEKDALQKIEADKFRKLYVMGLPIGTTEEDIREHFSVFGNVLRVSFNRYVKPRRRGTAFVLFETQETVLSILSDKSFQH